MRWVQQKDYVLGASLLLPQKTLIAVLIHTSTYANLGFSDHWYLELDRTILVLYQGTCLSKLEFLHSGLNGGFGGRWAVTFWQALFYSNTDRSLVVVGTPS